MNSEKLYQVAHRRGIRIHPGFIAGNFTLVNPDWMSDHPTCLQSYYVKSVAQHDYETHWAPRVPQMRHQCRFIMHKIGAGTMAHAGLAILLNQHREDKSMLFFEPMLRRFEVPSVVLEWAERVGVSRIQIHNGQQRAGSHQCVRHTLTYYFDWLRANQNLVPRDYSAVWENGRVTEAPRQGRPLRGLTPQPKRYWDGVDPNMEESEVRRLLVDLGPRVPIAPGRRDGA